MIFENCFTNFQRFGEEYSFKTYSMVKNTTQILSERLKSSRCCDPHVELPFGTVSKTKLTTVVRINTIVTAQTASPGDDKPGCSKINQSFALNPLIFFNRRDLDAVMFFFLIFASKNFAVLFFSNSKFSSQHSDISSRNIPKNFNSLSKSSAHSLGG